MELLLKYYSMKIIKDQNAVVLPLFITNGGSYTRMSALFPFLLFFNSMLCFRIICRIYLAVDITPKIRSSSLSFFLYFDSKAVDICLRGTIDAL